MTSTFTREAALAQPPSLYPEYRSTMLRSPSQPLVRIPQTITETTGPVDCWGRLMGGAFADLTTQHEGVALGRHCQLNGPWSCSGWRLGPSRGYAAFWAHVSSVQILKAMARAAR